MSCIPEAFIVDVLVLCIHDSIGEGKFFPIKKYLVNNFKKGLFVILDNVQFWTILDRL